MMPQRYFLENDTGVITGNDAHHIQNVMRLRDDAEIIVCHEDQCHVATIKHEGKRVHYQKKHQLEQPEILNITLVQGIPKHPKSDFVCKYATVFGVRHIIFVPMKRSIVKLENEANKLIRLERIAKEAAELAHRSNIPTIKMYQKLEDVEFNTFDFIIFADENESNQTLEACLSFANKEMKICIVIGPEGGIDDEERKLMETLKAEFVSLGSNVLPTEAAGLYVLSCLTSRFL
jgi:16S rRNA (uracil1498-N3)-methyltransferase